MKYQFRPKISMTIAAIAAAALCVELGSWQYDKAQAKLALQQQLEIGLNNKPSNLPITIEDKEDWRYKRVTFSGVYDTRYQVLLDNQVNDNRVGYHVITPVKVEGISEKYVLVNRGWIKGNLNRQVPKVDTPTGLQVFQGDIFFPLSKFFTLESPQPTNAEWQLVWQHIDMERYIKTVPFEVLPYVIKLSPESDGAGFARNWPLPSDRVNVHLGYAYQWFGFALTLLVIYIVLNVKKVNKGNLN